jgi:hypothetical protein
MDTFRTRTRPGDLTEPCGLEVAVHTGVSSFLRLEAVGLLEV